LEEAKAKLAVLTNELLTAQPARLPGLTIEIQRLRVACMLLREVENNIADSNTYREVALLNRLLTGRDIESEAEKKKSVEDAEKAARVLGARGVTPASAHRILKILNSVMEEGRGGEQSEPDEPDETADPQPPPAA